MATFQPPPTYAEVILEDPQTKRPYFNPIWLKWFIDIQAFITLNGGPFASLYGSASQTFSVGTATSAAHAVRLDQTSVNGPAFAVYKGTAIQSVTSGALTLVQFDTEEFDTASAFDSTTNYRFTPAVAGYYQFSWNVDGIANGSSVSAIASYLYKNGAVHKKGEDYSGGSVAKLTSGGSSLVYLNGTTDYVDVRCSLTGTTPRFNFGISSTYFTGALIRR